MKRLSAFLASLILFAAAILPCIGVQASAPTDEILNYSITVDVNEDATLNMLYHIEWKVLDDTTYGPLDWVQIGIPNANYKSCLPVSENIDNIKVKDSGSEVLAQVYFKDKYYKDDIVGFDFRVIQDCMYEMNVLKEGETVYYFTPGWFTDIPVDNIRIIWNADKATAWSHGATTENGFLVWSGSLSAGAKFSEISVTYPSDAFAFDTSKTVKAVESDNYYEYNNYSDNYIYEYANIIDEFTDNHPSLSIALSLIRLVPIILVWLGIGKLISKVRSYIRGSGFNSQPQPQTQKKITRTLIQYYPECPGCAAPRPENAEKCAYCGRSFIASEEVVEETQIQNPENYTNEGTYRYGSHPNTFVRVHVTNIPIVNTRSSYKSSCAHSSCAHSHCACAHSCACACACACAGGGRAGCSTKDFYNTKLKLKQIKLRKHNQQKRSHQIAHKT